MFKNRSKTSPQRVKIFKRQAAATELRSQGGSYEQVAETLRGLPDEERKNLAVGDGYDRSSAYKDVQEFIKRTLEEARESVEELRQIELDRIEQMWQAVFPYAIKADLSSVGVCLRLQDQRAKYFPGLQIKVGEDKTPRGASNAGGESGGIAGSHVPIREIVIRLTDQDGTLGSLEQNNASTDTTGV